MVKHVEVGYKMEAPEGCPPEIYEMMRQAWDLNPAKRPTFAELKVKLLHLKNNTAWNIGNYHWQKATITTFVTPVAAVTI